MSCRHASDCRGFTPAETKPEPADLGEWGRYRLSWFNNGVEAIDELHGNRWNYREHETLGGFPAEIRPALAVAYARANARGLIPDPKYPWLKGEPHPEMPKDAVMLYSTSWWKDGHTRCFICVSHGTLDFHLSDLAYAHVLGLPLERDKMKPAEPSPADTIRACAKHWRENAEKVLAGTLRASDAGEAACPACKRWCKVELSGHRCSGCPLWTQSNGCCGGIYLEFRKLWGFAPAAHAAVHSLALAIADYCDRVADKLEGKPISDTYTDPKTGTVETACWRKDRLPHGAVFIGRLGYSHNDYYAVPGGHVVENTCVGWMGFPHNFEPNSSRALAALDLARRRATALRVPGFERWADPPPCPFKKGDLVEREDGKVRLSVFDVRVVETGQVQWMSDFDFRWRDIDDDWHVVARDI